MPVASKFDAMKLRTMITEGKTAQQIMDAFDIPKTTLKNHLTKLMTLDEKFYKIEGMDARVASGSVKFSGTGLRLSPTLLANYSAQRQLLLGTDDNYFCASTSASAM
ncbi:ArsR family transcriptional regulator [Solidesulfovibrio sp. C21]|uniref:ArsR family transcriptional regulator n=1 Tax=Solidesulfovibrio sp. C21 TaxID=3398613 RepID=UPI0039FD5B82